MNENVQTHLLAVGIIAGIALFFTAIFYLKYFALAMLVIVSLFMIGTVVVILYICVYEIASDFLSAYKNSYHKSRYGEKNE